MSEQQSDYDERVERLAKKILHGGDGNAPAADDIETARKVARRMLEESEERTREATELEPDDDDVIRRTSGETAAIGDTGIKRAHEGE